jgi:hypothetical protein
VLGGNPRGRHDVEHFLKNGKFSSERSFRCAQKEILILKQELIRRYGGDRIAPDVRVLVDSAIEALAIQPLCLQCSRHAR